MEWTLWWQEWTAVNLIIDKTGKQKLSIKCFYFTSIFLRIIHAYLYICLYVGLQGSRWTTICTRTSTFPRLSWRRSSENFPSRCSPSDCTTRSWTCSVSPESFQTDSGGFRSALPLFHRLFINPSGVESSLRATRCKQLIESLPEHNFLVLKFLLGFLNMVSHSSSFFCTNLSWLTHKTGSENVTFYANFVVLKWKLHAAVQLKAW